MRLVEVMSKDIRRVKRRAISLAVGGARKEEEGVRPMVRVKPKAGG